MMRTACSSLGSLMVSGWKRRSSAESFSRCLRYSSRVVAPMIWISPRDSGGLQNGGRVDGAFRRAGADDGVDLVDEQQHVAGVHDLLDAPSSGVPRIRRGTCEPATSADTSSVMRRLLRRMSGTWLATMSWARPSAMAVLPTPGSPMMQRVVLLAAREDLHDALDFRPRGR